MQNKSLFVLLILILMIGCGSSGRDNKVGEIGTGQMPDNGLDPSAVNDINALSVFPSIAESFEGLSAYRTFSLKVRDNTSYSFEYSQEFSTRPNFVHSNDNYTDISNEKQWTHSQSQDGVNNTWADKAPAPITAEPIADLLEQFPPIDDTFSEVIIVSYTLTFSARPASEITAYRSKMSSSAFSCGAAANEPIANTCTARRQGAYLTFEIRNEGKSLVWSVGYI